MQVAQAHTLPLYMFELRDASARVDDPDVSVSTTCTKHPVSLVDFKKRIESSKTRTPLAGCEATSRLSQRKRQIERLRQLRNRRPHGGVHVENKKFVPASKSQHSSVAIERALCHDKSDQPKRHRGPAGEDDEMTASTALANKMVPNNSECVRKHQDGRRSCTRSKNNSLLLGVGKVSEAPPIAVDPTDSKVEANDADDRCVLAGESAPAAGSSTARFLSRISPEEMVIHFSATGRPVGASNSAIASVGDVCNVDSSQSCDGADYRGVIHVVGGLQHLKAHAGLKVKNPCIIRELTHDAKSQPGQDARPRSSEPRRRIAGVTMELEVLEAIIIRERMITTLWRLIKRLRQHCFKLQDCLRREQKFRRRYAEAPPDVFVSNTAAARTTLRLGQQELRVVLAHLRAISLETVKAIIEWRTTLSMTEKPGYGTLLANGTVRSTQRTGKMSLFSAFPGTRTRNGPPTGGGDEEVEKQSSHRQDVYEGADLRWKGHEASSFVDDRIRNNGVTFTIRDRVQYNSPAAFMWNGQNYLVKMSHDLDFLDDAIMSFPVGAWLEFSARSNPFLVPPVGHYARKEALRLEGEEPIENFSSRRQQQPDKGLHRHRHGRHNEGSSNGRCNPRSYANVGDSSTLPCQRHNTQERQEFCNGRNGSCVPNTTALEHGILPTAAESNQRSGFTVDQEQELAVKGGGGKYTYGGTEMMKTRIGSPPKSNHWTARGLGDLDEELKMFPLSKLDEREVQWKGGGDLDAPLVPPLPELIVQKALGAADELEKERSSEIIGKFKARGVAANSESIAWILREPRLEYASRMEWLISRSCKEGLREYLKMRHVGITNELVTNHWHCRSA